MTRTITKVAFTCLLLSAVVAQAAPLTFQFTATANGPGYIYPAGSGPLDVPQPFPLFDWAWHAPVSGVFTIDTDVVGTPGYSILNGVSTDIGSFYLNPVSQLSLDIRDQHFDFTPSQPPGSTSSLDSYVFVSDLPVPSDNPATNYDSYNLAVLLGTGIFGGPYSNLAVSFSLVSTEHDLSVIQSRDMAGNLNFTPNWNAFFTIYDSATNQSYQLNAPLTSLVQVRSVPEPGTFGLFAAALGFFCLLRRSRDRAN